MREQHSIDQDGRGRAPLRLAGLLVLAAILQACGGGGADATSERTLNRAIPNTPESFDIHRFRSTEAGKVLRDLGEGLTTYSADGALIPGVAESWSVSSDGLTYQFELRPSARWSNGDPVVADDFVAAFARLVDPETASPSADFVSMIENASNITAGELAPAELGVRALDDRRLEIRLNAPTPYFLQLLTHPTAFPIHRPTLAAHGEKHTKPNIMVSNGAYALTDYVLGSKIGLTRNHEYWDNDASWFESVNYIIVGEDREVTRYRAEELDFTANIDAGSLEFLEQEIPDEVHIAPGFSIYYYGFNLTKPFLRDNENLRKALSMAIDRTVIVEKIVRRGELPAFGWVPPGVDNYESQLLDYFDMPDAEREAEARRLFAVSGYGEDNPLTIEIRYNTVGGHQNIALAIQEMWRDVLGVNAELYNEEFQVFLSNVEAMEVTEVYRLSWGGDYNDANTFLKLFQSGSPQNLTAYENPEVDRLMNLAAGEVDLAKRRGYLEAAEKIALNDHPVIPLYFYVSKHLVKSDIEGWEDMPLDYHYSKDLSRNTEASKD